MDHCMRAVRSKDAIFLAWKDRDLAKAAESVWKDYNTSTAIGFPPPFSVSGSSTDNIRPSIF